MTEPPRKLPNVKEELPIPVEVLFDNFLMMQFLWDYISSNQAQMLKQPYPWDPEALLVPEKTFDNYLLKLLTQLNNQLNYFLCLSNKQKVK